MRFDLRPTAFKACKQQAVDQISGADPKHNGSRSVTRGEKCEVLVFGDDYFTFAGGADPNQVVIRIAQAEIVNATCLMSL